MKKVTVPLIAIIFIFCPLITATSADWTLSSDVGSAHIMGIGAGDSTHVRAAGHTGEIYLYNGSSWSFETGLGGEHRGAFALDANHFWAPGNISGSGARVCFYNGTSWTETTLNTSFAYDVYASDSTHAWTVSASGKIFFSSDGTNWALETNTGAALLSAIDGTGSSNVWAVGDRQVLSFHGTKWNLETEFTVTEADALRGVAVVGTNDVWVTGSTTGVVWHYDGNWNRSTDLGRTANYGPIAAQGANQIWTGGDHYLRNIFFFNGSDPWTADYYVSAVNIRSLDASVPREVWAGGESGKIYHLEIPTPTPSTTPTAMPTTTPTPSITPTPTAKPSATPIPTTPTPLYTTTPPPITTPTCGPTVRPPRFILESGDYNGDGTSDIAIFRRSSGLWAVRSVTRVYFGNGLDRPVSGDYNGDGAADIAIFRPPLGLWAIRGVSRIYYGTSGDFPAPADFDGDGTADITIFRANIGLWAIRGVTRAYYGTMGDSPIPDDYEGTGTASIGIFRPSTGLWSLRNFSRIYFGGVTDWTLPADYNGDGQSDIAIFRPRSGLWAIRGTTRAYFGSCIDYPVRADFNGNGTADITIFRQSYGLWAVREVTRAYFGTTGDTPVTR